jgi:hypothetical protein
MFPRIYKNLEIQDGHEFFRLTHSVLVQFFTKISCFEIKMRKFVFPDVCFFCICIVY